MRKIKTLLLLIKKGIVSLIRRGPRKTWALVKEIFRRRRAALQFEQAVGSEAADTPISTFTPYDSEYQENTVFDASGLDIKTLAFYLPQFHAIPENDEWWGKGFTEWNNTKKSVPRFTGHYQPRTPHADIGFYDLSEIENIKKQAILAKQHGIYGFCFYYYWFSGKRLLEKPLDLLLAHPEIDLPFMLCWANENWTRAWDGQTKNIIMKQNYSEEDDLAFIKDIKKYTDDPRYIKVDNKPVIMVYNPGEIPDVKRTFSAWRDTARKKGVGDILIWTCQTCNYTAEALKITDEIDAEVQFPPHNMWYEFIGVRDLDTNGASCFIYNYQHLVKHLEAAQKEQAASEVPLYRSSMLGWDNAARRQTDWTTFYAYSLESYYNWLSANVQYARQNFAPDRRFVFINAWNEWAEGTYLEPDEKYGYANINTTSRALLGIPFDEELKLLCVDDSEAPSSYSHDASGGTPVAVQIHLFHLECMDEILLNINYIPVPYDCYISTDTKEKQLAIQTAFQTRCTAKNITVQVFENKGRDMLPFILQMRSAYRKYDYICHIHSKNTIGQRHGLGWRQYLYHHLLGSEQNIQGILDCFAKDGNLGLIFPETYPPLLRQAEWGGNKDMCAELLKRIDAEHPLPQNPVFPVGNMFWMRSSAVKPIFESTLAPEDFPKEAGQNNATIAHAIERSWVYMAKAGGYGYQKTFNACKPMPVQPAAKRIAIFAHYDANGQVSSTDHAYIDALTICAETVIFVTNSSISDTDQESLRDRGVRVILSESNYFDFGAWRVALFDYGFERLKAFDELILANNSCFAPLFPLEHCFTAMQRKKAGFWGITLFPEVEDGSYLNQKSIPEHIQSYFMVFKKDAFQSDAFYAFWDQSKPATSWKEAIKHGETLLTHTLYKAGFSYDVLIPETRFMCEYLLNYSIPYSLPYTLLVLNSPFIKKKCPMHMSWDQYNRACGFVKQLTNAETAQGIISALGSSPSAEVW